MTAGSDSWSTQWDQRRRPPHRLHMPDQVLDRWWAVRTSRRFASVGVQIPAARLRQIREASSGAPVAAAEMVDVNFALAATEIKREMRLARARRTRRRATRWLIVAGLAVAALNLLVCMGYAFITLAVHEAPW